MVKWKILWGLPIGRVHTLFSPQGYEQAIPNPFRYKNMPPDIQTIQTEQVNCKFLTNQGSGGHKVRGEKDH